MTPAEKRDRVLQELANDLAKYQITTPIRIVVDAIAPLGVLASQMVLFFSPFMPTTRWRSYLHVLTDEAGWEAFQRILNSQEC